MTPDREERLIQMAAQLLNISMQVAQEFSAASEVQNAAELHDRRKLYPKLTVTSPHGGGGIRIELVLCDPKTDEALVSMYQAIALESETFTYQPL
ncbi:MAG: hypothetical protein WBJ75_12585 [Pseudohongiellaceae bacterium]